MSNLFTPIGPAGIGGNPGNGWWRVKNVTATDMVAGQVVMLDLTQTDGDTTSYQPGGDASVFGCVVQPNSVTNSRVGQFLVLLEAISAGGYGKAAPTGLVTVNIGRQNGDISKGDPLGVMTASGTASGNGLCALSTIGSFTATGSQQALLRGEKIVGYLAQTASIASTASNSSGTATALVWFNGIGAGFGQNAG